MVQLYRLHVRNRRGEFVEPAEESLKAMPSHPGSLPYTWMKHSDNLTLSDLLENPDDFRYMAMIMP